VLDGRDHVSRVKPPRIVNETVCDGRQVAALVRWVFRYLDLDGDGVMVKVKRTKNRWGGRFYSNPHRAGGHVYREAYAGAGYGEYVEVAPNVPRDVRQLIVVRVADSHQFPFNYQPYERVGNPAPWELADWREAIVTITAHEAMHLRQYRQNPRGKRGRYNEKQTEWGAFRAWRTWREDRKR